MLNKVKLLLIITLAFITIGCESLNGPQNDNDYIKNKVEYTEVKEKQIKLFPKEMLHPLERDSKYLIKRTKYGSATKNIANKLINNEIFISFTWDSYPFGEKLTWKENPFNSNNWQYRLHSLDMISYLTNFYEGQGSIEYLEKAKWYLEDWMTNNSINSSDVSPYAWHDMASANRVINIVYFLEQYKESEIYNEDFEENIIDSLKVHGDFLYQDANYTAHNNHGIYQIQSLLELSLMFPEMEHTELWYEKAEERLRKQIAADFTSDRVHKEHSPGYVVSMFHLLGGIDKLLKQYDKQIDILDEIVYELQEYMTYAFMENEYLPLIGDTHQFPIRNVKEEFITNSHFSYVKAGDGENPIENNKIYEKGGIAFFRNGWNVDEPFYLAFTSATHSLVHKHIDDLSFVLNYKGKDFFVDSGKYTYNESDPYRQYLRSVFAHNSIVVDEKDIPLSSDLIGKSKIEKSNVGQEASYVVASHNFYPGITIRRILLYLHTGTVFLHDEIEGSGTHTYSQNFHLGTDITLHDEPNEATLVSGDAKVNLIQQLPVVHRVYEGSDNPIRGWRSIEFEELIPTKMIEYTSTKPEFQTIINATDRPVSEVVVEGNSYTFVYNDGQRETITIN